MLHSICQQIWKTQQWPQVWKKSVFIPIPKKGNAKECSNYHTILLISHTSKVMLKILQSRLWQYLNREFPNVQAGYKKSRGTRDQIDSTCWIIEKVKEFQKTIYLLIYKAKAFDSVVHNKLWKILKEMGLPDHLTCLLRNLYAGQEATARTGHGTTWTGSKLGKEYIKAVYCHSAYLLICRVHYAKCQTGLGTSWNQDCGEKYQPPHICRWYYSNGRKQRGSKRASWWGQRRRVKKLA